eukprot:TRINITY_DN14232_c2_g2_i1.p1 TRINITY_DN14232_c2_g2~~TRINITY_DN14232_c2_g2_i1.p1  ORF type:complete len:721 (-),score=164.14 TRINITY_DN14232_c2_g2_i1:26-2155(-)
MDTVGRGSSGAASSSSSSRTMDTGQPPTRDDFITMKTLGEGSMGTVSKVLHRKSSKVFALKAIDKRRVRDHNLQAQLLEEVKTQMHLEHPNLLRCITYFEETDTVYLVLELAEGGDLYQRVRKQGALEEATAAKIFAQVCQGVKYLHDNGVIHRDLKPENILLTQDMTVKIADFGWAAKARAGAATRSTFCGTLCMLAPEMVAGKAYDGRVDVWAVGILLYEMLTGSSPFDKGEGLMETCKAITGGLDAASLTAVPAEAHSLIRGLLHRQADERMPLEDCLRHPWVVRHVGLPPEPPPDEAAKLKAPGSPSHMLPPGPPLLGEAHDDETTPSKAVHYELPPTDELLVKPFSKLPGGGAACSSAGSSHQKGYSRGSQAATVSTGADDAAISPVSPSMWPGRGGSVGMANPSHAIPRKSCGSVESGSGSTPPRLGERESISTVASLRSEGKLKLNERGEFLPKVEITTPELENKMPAAPVAAMPKAPPPTPDIGEVLPPGTQLNLSHAIPPRTQLNMAVPKTNLGLSPGKGAGFLRDLAEDSSGDEDAGAKERPFGSVGTPSSFQAGSSSAGASSSSRNRAQVLHRLDDDAAEPGAETSAFASLAGAHVVPRVFRAEQSGPSAKAPAPRSSAGNSHGGSSPAVSPSGSIGAASRNSTGQASSGGAAAAAEQLAGQLANLGFTYKQALEASKRTSSVEAAVGWLIETEQAAA